MSHTFTGILSDLTDRYPSLAVCEGDILDAYRLLEKSFSSGGKLLVCGNGGSAADCEHIVGELMKGFRSERHIGDSARAALAGVDEELGAVLADNLQGALPALSLSSQTALGTAFINDVRPDLVFAQQVYGYGRPGDVLLAISTSGESANVLYAAVTAKAKGMKVIGLTGCGESALSSRSDVCVQVPEKETYKIQELHLPIYHCLCMMLEERFFR